MAKRTSDTLEYGFDVTAGIITVNVPSAGSGKFDARQFAGEAAYDALTEGGKAMILHGGKQKLGDRAAQERDPSTGKPASALVKFEAIKELAEHLANGGDWRMKGGGQKALDRAALFQAISTARNVDAVRVSQVYQDRPDAVLRIMLTDREVAAE